MSPSQTSHLNEEKLHIVPIAVPQSVERQTESTLPEVTLAENFVPSIRSATVQDVHGMSALINQYASSNVMLARGPQYLYLHIQDYMVITVPDKIAGKEIVIACGAVHVLWEDLAEIRSIAVHPGCKGHKLGKLLVMELLERCRKLGIMRAFVFTLVPGFFEKCGFFEFERKNLPPVVWVECSKCPKFYRCDEIGMIRFLGKN